MAGSAKKTKPFIHMPAFLDSHMHIQSGNCAPLPIMWCKVPGLMSSKPERAIVNGLPSVFMGEGGRVNSSSTIEIADMAVKELDAFMALRKKDLLLDPYNDFNLNKTDNEQPPISMLFAMTFDMEYAHIDGYDGEPIYQSCTVEEIDRYTIFVRKSGFGTAHRSKPYLLKKDEHDRFQKWDRQIADTTISVLNHPWRILPLYHYDPRRWNYATETDVIDNKIMTPVSKVNLFSQEGKATDDLLRGTWDYPFSQIAGRTSPHKPGICIGFKMYTPHGYRPLDEKCPCLIPYYARCAKEGIPIVNHCSPGGNTVPDTNFYMEYLRGPRTGKGDTPEYTGSRGLPGYVHEHSSNAENKQSGEAIKEESNPKGDPAAYFRENFVHPRAWRNVLDYRSEQVPSLRNLKLCLAHFGSDEWQDGDNSDWIRELKHMMKEYPNVYTDVACFDQSKSAKNFSRFLDSLSSTFFARDGEIYHDKILFGTDWYMILLVLLNMNPATAGTMAAATVGAFATGAWGFSTFAIWPLLLEKGVVKGKKYGEFCLEMMKMLNKVNSDGWKLWYRFSIINPIKFYFYENGKPNEILIDNLMEGMKKELQNQLTNKNKYFLDKKDEVIEQIETKATEVKNLINSIPELEEKLKKS